MKHVTFGNTLIASAGYDPLCAVLEIEFTQIGQTRSYFGVSEDVWYGLRNAGSPEDYFRQKILGKYDEDRF